MSHSVKIKSSAANSFLNFVRSLDMYGHPVTLTFKKDSTYKSVLGGTVSILSFIGVVIYFLILLQALIAR